MSSDNLEKRADQVHAVEICLGHIVGFCKECKVCPVGDEIPNCHSRVDSIIYVSTPDPAQGIREYLEKVANLTYEEPPYPYNKCGK